MTSDHLRGERMNNLDPSELPRPTREHILLGKQAFAAQGQVTEAALHKLLHTFPDNTVTAEIYLKVVAINQIYGTGILAVQPVAERIQAAVIDADLRAGDPGVVHRIDRLQFVTAKGKEIDRSIYSFATKYCAHHQPEHYPIYDGIVSTKLLAYDQRDNFNSYRLKYADLRDYVKFKEVVLQFRAHYGLTAFSLRDIDQFLWILGKGLLPALPSATSPRSP
ncbi:MULTISPECIES: hypothetical protein [Deinococcus]|uniref:Uncharacterized protein n=1 Tax=Deinococcus rufus TaxID=2136097 RepID=A0ABV7Z7L8_9DEIO|nr:hypothetical protein [Deinococcus sp. AB2017081]WQE94658.1 hypothetical protein U2P90_14780 [Deinococcus sp. AB2017081]